MFCDQGLMKTTVTHYTMIVLSWYFIVQVRPTRVCTLHWILISIDTDIHEYCAYNKYTFKDYLHPDLVS